MNLHALPFYATRAEQLQRGPCRAYATQLASPADRFLPFVVKRPATGQGLDCILVYQTATDTVIATVLPAQVAVDVYTDGVNDYYVYFGGLITGLALPCDSYYLDVKGSFSEVFRVSDNTASLLKIEWRNTTDLAGLPYTAGFLQRLYLDAAIGEPDYKYTEEGEKDGNGEFVPLSRMLVKNWIFDTQLIPEFLLDVIQSLTLHDDVRIGRQQNAVGIKVKVAATTADACASTAQVEFSEPVVLAASCASPTGWAPVDTTGYAPKPWLCGTESDAPFWENTGAVRCVTVAQAFSSAAITEDVPATNCPGGTTAQPVSYTLAAGFYVSPVSQPDADAQARAYFDSTKQAYANANAVCTQFTQQVGVTVVERPGGGAWDATFSRNDTAGDLVLTYVREYDDTYSTVTTSGSVTIPNGQATVTLLVAPPAAVSASVTISSATPSTYTII